MKIDAATIGGIAKTNDLVPDISEASLDIFWQNSVALALRGGRLEKVHHEPHRLYIRMPLRNAATNPPLTGLFCHAEAWWFDKQGNHQISISNWGIIKDSRYYEDEAVFVIEELKSNEPIADAEQLIDQAILRLRQWAVMKLQPDQMD